MTNLFDKGKLDDVTLKIRMARLTELHHAFEDLNDELIVLDPDESYRDEFTHIEDRFYHLAGRVESHLSRANASTPDINVSSIENRTNQSMSVIVDKKRRVKLPEAPLPTFDGKFENWLSFKNAFHNLIDSFSDLSDVDKLYYLKAALKDEAANKIKIFTIDGINYAKAWEVLERAYEVKRVLITRHLSFLVNLPPVERECTDGLTKLADEAQQYVASLNALGMSLTPAMIVYLIETKLPKKTLKKWETSLERDECPSLESLYEFLYKTAVCVSKRDRLNLIDSEKVARANLRRKGGGSCPRIERLH